MVVLVLGLVIATVFFSITKLTTEIPSYAESATQQTADEQTTDPAAETTTEPAEVSIQIGEVAQGVIASVLNLLVQFGWALVIFFFMISAAITLPKPSRLGLDPNAPTIGRITHLTEDIQKYMTALIPPVLMAYAQYGIETAVIVLVGYILINGGVQNFIQPKLMGQRLKISPVVVFVGLFIWGYLLGGIGALLAVPLTLLVLIIMENFEGTRPLAILMRYTGEEEDEERKQAAQHVKGLWGKVKGTFGSNSEPES